MNLSILTGEPNSPPRFKEELHNFLASNNVHEINFAFAYISASGLRHSIYQPSETESFINASKFWIVGVHNGISEPVAIETLAEFPNSTVRIFTPHRILTKSTLQSPTKLHAKVAYCKTQHRELIIAGSFNLTHAALGRECSNYELGISIQSQVSAKQQSTCLHFNSWFHNIWECSKTVTPKIIDQYAKLRENLVNKFPIIASDYDEYPEDAIENLENLWIEAGAMSGELRHQIEFGPNLARFFGSLTQHKRLLRIQYKNYVHEKRPLAFKQTRWKTNIWRLGLVTPSQGGPDYQHMIIHFKKIRDSSGILFELNVAKPGSPEDLRWKQKSHRWGTISHTGIAGQGRMYGVY